MSTWKDIEREWEDIDPEDFVIFIPFDTDEFPERETDEGE